MTQAITAGGSHKSGRQLGRVGFIGLGVMGKPMALNLIRAGYVAVVHSRSPGPVQDLVDAGAEFAGSPAEVASRAPTIVTMLPDTPDVAAVLFGSGGAAAAARPGSLFMDMSTIQPLATRRFSERLHLDGLRLLDAPVSGGERGAQDASLSIMVGGSQEDFEEALPMLQAVGKTIVYMGAAGAGQVAKACNQLVVGTTIEAVGEALTLAFEAGVDPQRVRQALLGGFASSRVLEIHGQRMLERNFQPGFRAALHHKDSRIIVETAQQFGVPIPAFSAVAKALARLIECGRGDLDHSALVTLLEDESRSVESDSSAVRVRPTQPPNE